MLLLSNPDQIIKVNKIKSVKDSLSIRGLSLKQLSNSFKVEQFHDVKMSATVLNAQNKLKTKITIPTGLPFWLVHQKTNTSFAISGPRGTLIQNISNHYSCVLEGTRVIVLSCRNSEFQSEFLALVNSIYKMFVGVSKGYKSKIRIFGVGYKSFMDKQNTIKFVLGYSHDLFYKLDKTISIDFGRKNNKIRLEGFSLPSLSNTAAVLHSFKQPDIYKGKGLRYKGVPLPSKEGKKKK